MSVHYWDRLTELCGTFHARVRKLPTAARTALPPIGPARPVRSPSIGTLRPWGFILAGVCFGFLGYSLVSREAQIAWLKSHTPPKVVWEKLLLERGFVPVLDERTLFEIQNRVPRATENGSRIHVLRNRRAVFLLMGQDRLLFSLHSRSLPGFHPTDWEPLGYGWDAFEAFLSLEFPVHPGEQPRASPRLRPPPRDPREIHY